ncbi:unnamed protein product [Vitrella brassicaformis CCMP3155]|uniref:C3H1-type domain-containing protein n=2 Tax=Vitrella brassicaformis TaxID=1169539 RepID=A0A0G4GKT4_VITBC|nr:unnamed protein product [Vitrella brassicaformis CCMP3155]|mmetsp:Transcript_41975/g.104809  ORF Transcript_41975/g.104809 Transcript_41975/m.104809 type:complete len:284 (+) Transcript_41975:96-947(+)|eukprot:CEM30630.1 unnamed protein product [Vitrella brassicaformis CCMP3155]
MHQRPKTVLKGSNLAKFRTLECKHGASCPFGRGCVFSHNHEEGLDVRRRPYRTNVDETPIRLEYGPERCAYIDDPERCPRGPHCPFAHSVEELRFHPLTYKTIVCEAYQAGACRDPYCPDIHNPSERRHVAVGREYLMPSRRVTLNQPPAPAVVVQQNPLLTGRRVALNQPAPMPAVMHPSDDQQQEPQEQPEQQGHQEEDQQELPEGQMRGEDKRQQTHDQTEQEQSMVRGRPKRTRRATRKRRISLKSTRRIRSTSSSPGPCSLWDACSHVLGWAPRGASE